MSQIRSSQANGLKVFTLAKILMATKTIVMDQDPSIPHHSGFGLGLGSALGVACCGCLSAGGGVAGFRVSGFGAGGWAASSDGCGCRSAGAGAFFAAGLAAGGAGSTAFLIGSAGFAGTGWERFGCAFGATDRMAAACRAGITGAIGFPSGIGLASAKTAGRP